jgi:hypothetical protein
MVLTDKELEAAEAVVSKLVVRLMEMGCDSVRVIATASSKGGQTSILNSGAGNYFAQLGSVSTWVKDQGENSLIDGISEAVNMRPPEDGDNWKDEQ